MQVNAQHSSPLLQIGPMVYPGPFLRLSLGCVLHGFIPLPGSGRSSGPWSHSTWSFRWDCLLPETRLVQTWRSTGFNFCMSLR